MQSVTRDSYTGHEPPARERRGRGRFVRHYVEMVVAMFVGMFVLSGVLRAGLSAADISYTMERHAEVMILETGLAMAVGMGVWMRIRRHGWAGTLEMSGAMLVPAAGVVPLVALNVLTGGAAMLIEHVVMFPLMLAVMLRRRDEYLTHQHR